MSHSIYLDGDLEGNLSDGAERRIESSLCQVLLSHHVSYGLRHKQRNGVRIRKKIRKPEKARSSPTVKLCAVFTRLTSAEVRKTSSDMCRTPQAMTPRATPGNT